MKLLLDSNNVIVYNFNNYTLENNVAILDNIQTVSDFNTYTLIENIPKCPLGLLVHIYKYIDDNFVVNLDYNTNTNNFLTWDKSEFRRRFTRIELSMIDNYEKYIDITMEQATEQQRSQAKDVFKSVMTDFDVMETFNSNDVNIMEALTFFAQIGFIQPYRINEILMITE